MNIEKLSPLPMRKEDEQGDEEKELWQPRWDCFCCADTGIVRPHLAALALDGYNPKRHKFPRCVSPGCKAGSEWDGEALRASIDYRISSLTCQKLDAIEREGWRGAIKQTLEAIQKKKSIETLAKELSIRKSDRTPDEQSNAQMRHESASNADPAKLRAMAAEYMGEKWLEEGAS